MPITIDDVVPVSTWDCFTESATQFVRFLASEGVDKHSVLLPDLAPSQGLGLTLIGSAQCDHGLGM